MEFQTPNLIPALPELFILGMASMILLVDLFLTERTRAWSYLLALLTLVGAALLTVNLAGGDTVHTFSGMFVRDALADVLKLVAYLVTGVVFLYSREYLRDRGLFSGEYFVLGLFALLGIMVMISAHHFIVLYLGLELMSLCLYAMVAIDRDNPVASEAAMKYFVLGAIASGALLYGMSILYGVTGTLDIRELSGAVTEAGVTDVGLLFGLAFVLVGLAFKFGAVPFHMWIPDVYHGSPTSVTLFLGSVPKLAAFAMMMRLLVDGLGDLHGAWQDIVVVLAALSMAVGNVLAIAQSNIKRLLAYSTISHVGFILLGFLPGDGAGYASALFYTLTYVIMATGAFGLVILLSRAGFEADELTSYKGLGKRAPWAALLMMLLMVSMAGVPPLVGFWAKVEVIRATLDAGFTALAVFAVLMSAVGLFYYLKVVWLMYFEEAEESGEITAGIDTQVVLSFNALAVLALGLFPGGLLALCLQVMA